MLGVSIVISVLVDAPPALSRARTTRPALEPNFGTHGGRVNVSDGYRIGPSISGGGMPVDCAIDTRHHCN
jgi:hypothetical protein